MQVEKDDRNEGTWWIIRPAKGRSQKLIAGKLLMPADLQRLHQFLLDSKTVRAISDEMRLAVEALWPELAYKLPPKEVA